MRKENLDIKILADNTLSSTLVNIYRDSNVDLKPFNIDTQQDDGEDFLVKLIYKFEAEKDKFFQSFYIQNKGTDKFDTLSKIKIENKKYIQYQIKIRNIKRYYYELDIPLVITLVDIKTNIVYWYTIQLDKTITEKIEKNILSNKKTIQISIPFDNILNKENSVRFIDELIVSKNLIASRNNRINQYYDNIEVVTLYNEENIIDNILKFIDLFDGLYTIPYFIFQKKSPFTIDETKNTHFKDYTFFTDSVELISFFENIIIKNNLYFHKNNSSFIFDKEFHEKTKRIIYFLKANCIHHITLLNSHKKQVCIHELFAIDVCKCSKCLFEGFDYDRLLNIDKNDVGNDTFEVIKWGYVLSKLEKFKESLFVYKSVFDKIDGTKSPLLKLFCSYNITELLRVCKSHYNYIQTKEILANSRLYHFDDNYIEFRIHLKSEQKAFINWIRDKRFYSNSDMDITESKNKIEESFLQDSLGGSNSNPYIEKVLCSWNRFTLFTAGNALIYDIFQEYKLLQNKTVEAIICSYSIKNNHTYKLHNLNENFIKILIETEYSKLNFYFKKYDVDFIEFGEYRIPSISKLKQYCENIFTGFKHYYYKEKGIDTFHYETLINKFKSCLILLKYIKVDYGWLNNYILNLQKFAISIPANHHFHFIEFIYALVFDQKIKFSISVYHSWFNYALKHNKSYYSREIISAYPEVLYHFNNDYIVSQTTSTKIFNWLKINESNHNIDSAIEDTTNYYSVFSKVDKERYKSLVNFELKRSFNSTIYYTCCIDKVIDYKEYLIQYVQTIPTCKYINENANYFNPAGRNIHLNEFINLCYLYNIDFKNYQYLHSNEEYFVWLMNLNTFDYAKFNPYWIIQYYTSIYISEFKKHPQIKLHLKTYLKKHKVKSLINIYLEHFE
jgi:hypothetical protein